MKIIDILNLLKTNKLITIFTTNKIEYKLLYDRIKLHVSENIQLIDEHTIKINESVIEFHTPDTLNMTNNCSLVIIEFPEDFPKFFLNNLKASDIIFCNVEIV